MAANPVIDADVTIPGVKIKTQENRAEGCEPITLKQRIEQLLHKMFEGHGENYFEGF
jgi:hypothetical protein